MTAYPKQKVRRSKGRARPSEPLADWCEVGIWAVCGGRAVHRHHLCSRAQGGTDDPSNTRDVCSACHSHIHAHPAWSFEHGWLLHARAGDNQQGDTP